MAKHETSSEETITISKKELADVVGIAVQAALAAQAPTPERKRIDAQAQVDEHLASLRPEADMARVRFVPCRAPNGATFDARQAFGNKGWRTITLENYKLPSDLVERLRESRVEVRQNPDGSLPPEVKHEVSKRYWIGDLVRYCQNAEMLPVDPEEVARREAAKSDQAAE